MRMRGPNNVGKAVQTDTTLLRYASAIMEQKNVGSCWFKSLTGFKLCTTTRNNFQQGAQTDATMLRVVVQQYCVRLRGALQTNFSKRTAESALS